MRQLPALNVALAVLLAGLVVAGTLPSVYGLAALWLLVAAVYWSLRDRIHDILLVFVTVFLLLVVISNPAPRLSDPIGVARLEQRWAKGPFDDRLPVILHLVFDEMMSPGAADQSVPETVEAREILHRLGGRYGLRTFDSVYSRSYFSGVSLPNLFNSEYLGQTGQSAQFPKVLLATPHNAYFDDFASRGYRTAVFQTSLLDFCGNRNVDMCETFPSWDPGVLRSDTLHLRARAGHVLTVLLRSYEPGHVSRYGEWMVTGVDPRQITAAQKLGTERRFDVQGFIPWFERFVGFVERVPRGTHVFAHFMMPHAPYLMSPDCTITGDGGAGYYLAERFPDAASRELARRQYYKAYVTQLHCVVNRIGTFLDAVQRNPALRDARILIHGDHGSRISSGNRIEDYRREDFISNYATYFAIRAPDVEAGADCRFLSLAEAFRAHVGAQNPAAIDRPTPPVLVQSKAGDNVRVEASMPRFGCASAPATGRQ